jgi:hypothetical protein
MLNRLQFWNKIHIHYKTKDILGVPQFRMRLLHFVWTSVIQRDFLWKLSVLYRFWDRYVAIRVGLFITALGHDSESLAFKTSAYLRKNSREKDYPLGLTTPPPSDVHGVPDSFAWRSCWKVKTASGRGPSNGSWVARLLPRKLRDVYAVSWSLRRTLRLKPFYAMDETTGHSRVSAPDFGARLQMIVEDELYAASWWSSDVAQ